MSRKGSIRGSSLLFVILALLVLSGVQTKLHATSRHLSSRIETLGADHRYHAQDVTATASGVTLGTTTAGSPATTATGTTAGTTTTTGTCPYTAEQFNAKVEEVKQQYQTQQTTAIEKLKTELQAQQTQAIKDSVDPLNAKIKTLEADKAALLAKTCPSERSFSFLPWFIKNQRALAERTITETKAFITAAQSQRAPLQGLIDANTKEKGTATSEKTAISTLRSDLASYKAKLDLLNPKIPPVVKTTTDNLQLATQNKNKYETDLANNKANIERLVAKSNTIKDATDQATADITKYQALVEDAIAQLGTIKPVTYPWDSTTPVPNNSEPTCPILDVSVPGMLENVMSAKELLAKAQEEKVRQGELLKINTKEKELAESETKSITNALDQANKVLAEATTAYNDAITLQTDSATATRTAEGTLTAQDVAVNKGNLATAAYDTYANALVAERNAIDTAITAANNLISYCQPFATLPDNDASRWDSAAKNADSYRKTFDSYKTQLQTGTTTKVTALGDKDAKLKDFKDASDGLKAKYDDAVAKSKKVLTCPPDGRYCDKDKILFDKYNTVNANTASIYKTASDLITLNKSTLDKLNADELARNKRALDLVAAEKAKDQALITKANDYLKANPEKICKDPTICEYGKETPDCKSPYEDKASLQTLISNYNTEKQKAEAQKADIPADITKNNEYVTTANSDKDAVQSNVDALEPERKIIADLLVKAQTLQKEQSAKIVDANKAKSDAETQSAQALADITTYTKNKDVANTARLDSLSKANALEAKIKSLNDIVNDPANKVNSIGLYKIAAALNELTTLNDQSRNLLEQARQQEVKMKAAEAAAKAAQDRRTELQDIVTRAITALGEAPTAEKAAQDAIKSLTKAGTSLDAAKNSLTPIVNAVNNIAKLVKELNALNDVLSQADTNIINAVNSMLPIADKLLAATTYETRQPAKEQFIAAEKVIVTARNAIVEAEKNANTKRTELKKALEDLENAKKAANLAQTTAVSDVSTGKDVNNKAIAQDETSDKSMAAMTAEVLDAKQKDDAAKAAASTATTAENQLISDNKAKLIASKDADTKAYNDALAAAKDLEAKEKAAAEAERKRAELEKNAKTAAEEYIKYATPLKNNVESAIKDIQSKNSQAEADILNAQNTKNDLENKIIQLVADKKTAEEGIAALKEIYAAENKKAQDAANQIGWVSSAISEQANLVAAKKQAAENALAAEKKATEEAAALQIKINAQQAIIDDPNSTLRQQADAAKALVGLKDEKRQLEEKALQQKAIAEAAKIASDAAAKQIELLNTQLAYAKEAKTQAEAAATKANGAINSENAAISAIDKAIEAKNAAVNLANAVITAANDAKKKNDALLDALNKELDAFKALIDAANNVLSGDFKDPAQVNIRWDAAKTANAAIDATVKEVANLTPAATTAYNTLQTSKQALTNGVTSADTAISAAKTAVSTGSADLKQAQEARDKADGTFNKMTEAESAVTQQAKTNADIAAALAQTEEDRSKAAQTTMAEEKGKDVAAATIAKQKADDYDRAQETKRYDSLVEELNGKKQIAQDQITNANNQIATAKEALDDAQDKKTAATDAITDLQDKKNKATEALKAAEALIAEAKEEIKATTDQLAAATEALTKADNQIANQEQAKKDAEAAKINYQNKADELTPKIASYQAIADDKDSTLQQVADALKKVAELTYEKAKNLEYVKQEDAKIAAAAASIEALKESIPLLEDLKNKASAAQKLAEEALDAGTDSKNAQDKAIQSLDSAINAEKDVIAAADSTIKNANALINDLNALKALETKYINDLDAAHKKAQTAYDTPDPAAKAEAEKATNAAVAALAPTAQAIADEKRVIGQAETLLDNSKNNLSQAITAAVAAKNLAEEALSEAQPKETNAKGTGTALDNAVKKLDDAKGAVDEQAKTTADEAKSAKEAEEKRHTDAAANNEQDKKANEQAAADAQSKADEQKKVISDILNDSEKTEEFANNIINEGDSKLDQLADDKSDISSKAAICSAQVVPIQQKLKEMSEKLALAETQLTEATNNLAKATESKNSADSRYTALQEEATSLRTTEQTTQVTLTADNKNLKKMIEDMNFNLAMSQDTTVTTATQRTNYARVAEQLAKEIKTLSLSIAESESLLATTQKKIENNKAESLLTSTWITEASNSIKTAQLAKTAAEDAKTSIKAAITALNTELADAQSCIAQANQLAKDIAELEKKLQEQKAIYEDIKQKADAVQALIDELAKATTAEQRAEIQNKLNEAKDELRKAAEDAKALDNQIKALNDKLDADKAKFNETNDKLNTDAASANTATNNAVTAADNSTSALAKSDNALAQVADTLNDIKDQKTAADQAVADIVAEQAKKAEEATKKLDEDIKKAADNYAKKQEEMNSVAPTEESTNNKAIDNAHKDVQDATTPEEANNAAKDGYNYAIKEKQLQIEAAEKAADALAKAIGVNNNIAAPKTTAAQAIAKLNVFDILDPKFASSNTYLLEEDIKIIEGVGAQEEADAIDDPCSTKLRELGATAESVSKSAKESIKSQFESENKAIALAKLAIRYNNEYIAAIDNQLAGRQNIIKALTAQRDAHKTCSIKAGVLAEAFKAITTATTDADRQKAIENEAAAKADFDKSRNEALNADAAAEAAVASEGVVLSSQVARAQSRATTYVNIAQTAYNSTVALRGPASEARARSNDASTALQNHRKTCHRRRILASSTILL